VGGGIVVPVLEFSLRFAGARGVPHMSRGDFAAAIMDVVSSARTHHARGAVDWERLPAPGDTDVRCPRWASAGGACAARGGRRFRHGAVISRRCCCRSISRASDHVLAAPAARRWRD
jgi:hypothetical protein